jgi:hypothetical protein
MSKINFGGDFNLPGNKGINFGKRTIGGKQAFPENPKFATGIFSKNASGNQNISIGFTPKIFILMANHGYNDVAYPTGNSFGAATSASITDQNYCYSANGTTDGVDFDYGTASGNINYIYYWVWQDSGTNRTQNGVITSWGNSIVINFTFPVVNPKWAFFTWIAIG